VSDFEVDEPILCTPFDEPKEHWHLVEGEPPRRVTGRRPARYFYRPPSRGDAEARPLGTTEIELKLVNRIRAQLAGWRAQGYPGVSRTTLDLLAYWHREGREHRLFFAQLEAAETIIFLTEARGDFLQGIDVPPDEPSAEKRGEGIRAFRRYACKMATGSGKTTVMALLAAWSILNKVASRSDARFSDVVLVVCPNVTIRSRLREIDPREGEAGLYRTRDLVPPHLMPRLTEGRVLVTNWHVFELQAVQQGGVSAKVVKAGVEQRTRETITIGPKTTTARGRRYLTANELERQIAAGLIHVLSEKRDKRGNLEKVEVESLRYVESDTAFVNRVLGREVGGKSNVLVLNDEAHHAYRIQRDEPSGEGNEEELFPDEDDREEFYREATVWIEGMDRIHKLRGINFCVDLSATPYYLGRMGSATNRIFPWVVSDFALTDAIESGLVKIPQLAVRDTTGAEIPGYSNIWRWILPRLTPAERGGRKGSPKPEAILKYANTPIAMLASLWDELRREWEREREDPRPPVFILVCRDTRLAKLVSEWLGEGKPPAGIPPAGIEAFLNRDGREHTIRVDSNVVRDTDSGEAKSDETRWMRFRLDTVGKLEWPRDRQGRPIYPDGFEELAKKLARPFHPPGRDVRCIVSVAMLTEGWDCNTVTHIVGLRPFMSQLLCEQVVGRGLRRTDYRPGGNGRLSEEVAKIFGVPFELIPMKASAGPKPAPEKRHHVRALPERAHLEIQFPRVEGYQLAVRNRVTLDPDAAPIVLDPADIPPEVQMKAGLPTNKGRPSLTGPGRLESVDLSPFRSGKRIQELIFELARDLTRSYVEQPGCEAPSHVLFPQLGRITEWYLTHKVTPLPPAHVLDVFLCPYYGWVIERLAAAIRPDQEQGEAPELPRYETHRGPGSTAEVEFWTSRDVRDVVKSHVNYVVADTAKWEQSATYAIDTHSKVEAFVKNAGLGFAIPYHHNGQPHDYVPDFIIRMGTDPPRHLILETKGYDDLAEVKRLAAERWVAAVNAEGSFGHWGYAVAKRPTDVRAILDGEC
jgi:type III restriction enzyme